MIRQVANHNGESAILVLGGGGARGIAHFGVYRSLVDAGFKVDRMVGTSMGAMVGAVLATTPPDCSPAEAERWAIDYLGSERFRAHREALGGSSPWNGAASSAGLLGWLDSLWSYVRSHAAIGKLLRRPALLDATVVEAALEELVPDIDLSETNIPLSIVAVDLLSGHRIVLERGPLRRALQASMAIPGIFPPVPWDGMLLGDLGVLESLPTEVAASYPGELIIASDVAPSMEYVRQCPSAIHALLRMDEIGERLFRRHAQQFAHLLIQPQVGQFQWWDFARADDIIRRGEEAARQAIARWNAASQAMSTAAATSAAGDRLPTERFRLWQWFLGNASNSTSKTSTKPAAEASPTRHR
ncbi:MAG: hypothetical protein KatS3mg111_1005 [Pirellulaceae bacterium]|nr:MAG: hypothetical protein KatS3mg111_1005 [Pirellulaceae bacterium]